MDIDISDILADVSRLPPPPQQRSHSSTTATTTTTNNTTYLDSSTTYADHQLLVRAWTSERCSPTLLPYPTTLIDRTMSRITAQITRIEDLTAGIDTSSSTTGPATNRNTNLILSILQTDLSRTQFIVRSYLRQRLDKLTRFAGYYLKLSQSTDDKGRDADDPLLSPAETNFLANHQALLSRFYDGCFLGALPENLRRLDDRAGVVDMVEGPDVDGAVVVRCLRETWGNERELGGEDNGEEEGGAQTELRMRRGEVWVVRWRDVKGGVGEGGLELL